MKRFVLYIQYTSPANYPPLEHSGMILLKAGWDVRYFGIQSAGASSKLAFPVPLADRVTLWNHPSAGWRQKLHFILFTLSALARAWSQRPAWVYCSDPMSCPAAWLILRLTRCKVLYHEHDSPAAEAAGETTGPLTTDQGLREERPQTTDHGPREEGPQTTDYGPLEKGQQDHGLHRERPRTTDHGLKDEEAQETRQRNAESSPDAKGQSSRSLPSDSPVVSSQSSRSPAPGGFTRALLWFRRAVGREADVVVLPNEKRLAFFKQTTGRETPSICVYNCPRRDEALVQRRSGDANHLRILFHGSLNYQQPPTIILEAMSKLGENVTLTVVGYPVNGSLDCMERYQEKARTLGLQHVRYLGPLPRYELLKAVKDSDVGLALFPMETSNVNLKYLTGASNKPFDYLACGLALLVSDLPDWKAMFVEPGYGLACNPNDADSVAAQLRWFLKHPKETCKMGEQGRQIVLTEWNYEKQFSEVMVAFDI